MLRQKYFLLMIAILLASCSSTKQSKSAGRLRVSSNGRYFTKQDGRPFFWLGDTGWLLFTKLTREEAVKYLDDRHGKEFNVIQVMVLHTLGAVNVYGDSALIGRDVSAPKTTKGSSFSDSVEYDFWDHVDFVIDEAARRDIYMALVPVWGSNVKAGHVSRQQAESYAGWLAERYKNKPNVIWINGGDIKGSDSTEVWKAIGNELRDKDPNHLIGFHPRGRNQSSMWFHQEPWLDFNMFQSGHRTYAQDTSAGDLHYGEDNWKYVLSDYKKIPARPTLDGEPSYEGIPYGLHDTTLPRWNDDDVRRYGYWSVFAGACGFTYGDNAVIQMHQPSDKGSAYGAKKMWYKAINDTGASQMKYLKELMLSRPYFDRIPDQALIQDQGSRYDYVAATRGKDYAFIYTYNGRNFKVNAGKIGAKIKAEWYSPGDGSKKQIGTFESNGPIEFDPPGNKENGNDWVLILDKAP